MPSEPLLVAVGVLAVDGRFLVTRRHDNTHQGGLWEFPGGKVEAGETIGDALSREFREELGIEIGAYTPLLEITHRYPEKVVSLAVLRISTFRGSPRGLEGQPLRWVTLEELLALEFPAANGPIIEALMRGDGRP